MEEWSIQEIREDLSTPGEERWLLIYNAPPEFAPDGVFSYSFPKMSFTARAAEFGYNVDDPDEIEDLFQHVIHEGYLMAAGDRHDGMVNPYVEAADSAKKRVKDQLASVRKTVRLSQAARPLIAVNGRQTADTSGDVLDVIRNNMQIDRPTVAEWRQRVEQSRRVQISLRRATTDGQS